MNSGEPARPVEILLVEDNPGDVRLIQEALENEIRPNKLHVVSDGEEALDFIHRRGKYDNAPRPDLVLLDFSLPKDEGRRVLETIKREEDLRRIPVVVLTASTAENDVLRAYSLDANCYVTKPTDFGEFMAAIKAVGEFWLTIAVLPRD